MPYLFLVSIGPVQGFIASARKTRDLWFSSTLLSELAKAAAQEIIKSNEKNTLIFPAPQNMQELEPETQLNVANKIIAVINQSPQTMGASVRKAIDKRLHDIQTDAYKKIKEKDFNENDANKQINDLVEVSWLAVPYDGNSYDKRRKELEALMAARKNTRDFHQVTWGSNIPKSSLDGQLESVIREPKYPDRKDSERVKTEKVNFLYRNYRAGPAERLSGVDLLKRNGTINLVQPSEQNASEQKRNTESPSGFPSTSHMAAIPFLRHLTKLGKEDKNKATELWNKYIKAIEAIPDSHIEYVPGKYAAGADAIIGDCDGSLFFGERLVDMVDTGYNKESMATKLKPAQKALQAFFDEVKTHPNPYYAILIADGDRMGEAIDHEAQQKEGDKRHRDLSQALDKFDRAARQIVEENQGALVYAGGDDVLTFMPLHTVLKCANELHEDFGTKLANFRNKDDHPPTLSVGIAIIHHLYPLQDALNLARTAEKTAKQVSGKDALAITISKRSGDDYTIASNWGNVDSHLNKLITYCRDDAIPDGTAYELRDMVLRLKVPTSHPQFKILQEVILADADRILNRKMKVPTQKQDKLRGDKAKEILNILQDRLGIARKQKEPYTPTTTSVGIEQFINELIIAQTLADVQKLAEPKKE